MRSTAASPFAVSRRALPPQTQPYSNIVALAQTEGYFVFVFGKNHGQVYDKAGISGGTAEQFRRFIEDKTGQVFESV